MSFDIRKVKNMKSLVYRIMLFGLLVFNSTVYPNEPNILWNDECPAVVLGTEQERQKLKEEFPEITHWFGTFLNWQEGVKIAEPNESLQKEIQLTEKVCREVLKPNIVPLESIKDNLLQITVDHSDKTVEDMLQFRVRTNKYVIKFIKRKYQIIIIIRPVSGEIKNIKELITDVFNKRILPMRWEPPFCMNQLETDNKEILSSGHWMSRDNMRINSNGNSYSIRGLVGGGPRPESIPIGEGLYGSVRAYTDNKFAMFIINHGPRILKEDAKGYPGSAGTGENIED